MKFYNSHPLSIIGNLYRYLYLLFIPFIRGIVYAFLGGYLEWLKGAWIDILVIVCIVFFAIVKWKLLQFCITEQDLIVKKGIFFRQTEYFPLKNIATISIISHFYLKPWNAVVLCGHTLLGVKKANIYLLIKKNIAENLIATRQSALNIQTDLNAKPDVKQVYRAKFIHLIALSLLTSNSFVGILFIYSFISQSGKIVGEQFSNGVYTTFERLATFLAFGIPPFLAVIAYIFLGGWGVAFVLNLVRNARLTVSRNDNELYVKRSIISNRSYSIATHQISFMDIRQSVMTKLFSLYSVFVYAIGFTEKINDITSIIPACSKEHAMQTLQLLFPEFTPKVRELKPNKGAILKFIGDPLFPTVLIPLITFIFYRLFSNWADFIIYLGLMLSIPTIWFLCVRLIDFCTSGIAKADDVYTLYYSRGYYLHTIMLKEQRIAMIDLRQSVFQLMDKKCDLLIYSRSKGVYRHHIRNLDKQLLLQMFRLDETSCL